MLSSLEAGKRLGISARRVLVLINERRLPALMGTTNRHRRGYQIREQDLKLVAIRKPGRPWYKEKMKKAS